jgi:multiple sugar transport system permease protein
LRQKDGLFIAGMLAPAVAATLLMTYYPIGKGIIMAFQNYNLYNLKNVKFVGLENFIELFTPGPFNSFYGTMFNTAVWVLGSLIPQVIIGFALALLLRKNFFGRNVYQGVSSFPWAVSGFIIGIMWRWMYNGSSGVINDIIMRLGLINAPYGWLSETDTALYAVIIANIWYGIPFFVIMITAGLQSVPEELYEAADVDGANGFLKFRVITLPHIKSVLILTTMLRLIWIFSGPEMIFSMTNGGPAGSTQIMTSYMYSLITSLDYGMASAVGVVCTIFLVIFTLFYLQISRFSSEDA